MCIARNIFLALLVPVLIGFNIFQVSAQREDFPFTKWGMYSNLRAEGAYNRIEIIANGDLSPIDLFREMGGVAFDVDDLLRERAFLLNERVLDKHDIFENESLTIVGIEVDRIFRNHVFPSLNQSAQRAVEGRTIEIYISLWKHLQRENMFIPDTRIKIYEIHAPKF